MWTVRVALQRPYSFVVLASLNRDIWRTGGRGGAQSGGLVLDPLSRWRVVVSRCGDGAKRRAGPGALGDCAARANRWR
jgi:hypothetical protein